MTERNVNEDMKFRFLFQSGFAFENSLPEMIVPLIILATGNLWNGSVNPPLSDMFCRMACMLCVDYIEELIFRGFLFKAIAKTFANEAGTLILTKTLPKMPGQTV